MSFGTSASPHEHEPFRLAVVVGHSLRDQGALLHGGGTEYLYNKRIAELMLEYARKTYAALEVHLVFRDVIGIAGAYRDVEKLCPDACLELHFNASDTTAAGTETLTTPESLDRQLAASVQVAVCTVFERGGPSRGVKVIPRSARGGVNVYSLPGSANCLVEPFFGDNPVEAALAVSKQGAYAEALVDAVFRWLSVRVL